MRDASNAVDRHLTNNYGIGLEQVIADATQGLVSLVLAGKVGIAAAQRIAVFAQPDGGQTELHQGVLTVEGVQFPFRSATFIDAGGARSASVIAEFEPIGGSVRIAVDHDTDRRR